MVRQIDSVVRLLRDARVAKGLSQRDLSAHSGVPQGHISRIESGAVDLRVSSLIALARALDLEPMLVPRRSVAVVRSVAGNDVAGEGVETGRLARRARRALARLWNAADDPAGEKQDSVELAELRRHARELRQYRPALLDARVIGQAAAAAAAASRGTGSGEDLRHALARLRAMRDRLAQGRTPIYATASVRPAYSLDGDDDG